VLPPRRSLKARLSALYRRTALNPYWLDLKNLSHAVESLAPQASGRMLDVGVGERPYATLFAPHVSRYFGLEYPPACDNLNPGITVNVQHLHGAVDVWGDGHKLPFRSGRFDTVLCLEMLEHVPDPDAVMAEIARTLRPGGKLLLTVPFVAPMHALPYDFYRYTRHGIEALVTAAGLELVSCAPRGNYALATGALTAQWMLRSFAARAEHRDGSVSLSRWRAPLVLPLIALVQGIYALAGRFGDDTNAALGWTVVARKPD
jgi:SAM-dependent methyltransferase